MNLGRPSFQRLFGRSRYQYLQTIGDENTGSAHGERERFATAAIAFCLKHDPIFRAHFWKSVCWNGESKEHPPKLGAKHVWLEPPAWADLSVRYLDENGKPVWIVIEVKTGAALQPHQNPTLPAFVTPGTGYGWFFAEAAKQAKTKLRYILLGTAEILGSRVAPSVVGIDIQERGWEDLLHGRPSTSLSDDLVASLAALSIDAFTMEHAKKIKLTHGLAGAGYAWTVITAICQWLGAKAAQQQFDAYTPERSDNVDDSGTDEFGMYLKPPPKNSKCSDTYRRISELAGNKRPVIWFGYLTDVHGVITKSVYVYCRNEKGRDALADKLKASFDQPTVGREEDEYFVIIESPPEKQMVSDVEWFKAVLETVSKASPKTWR